MTTAAWIGSLAAILSVASFTPQAWKIIRERRTSGLSAATDGLTCAGFALWAIYGVLKGDPAIIVPKGTCPALARCFPCPPEKVPPMSKSKATAADDLVALTDTNNPSLTACQPEFAPGTGLSEGAYAEIADELGKVLADSFQLFIKTQGVHWNVAGAAFYGLHKLTEQQYGEIYEAIDEIAERIRALGHKAPASYTTYGHLSCISDEDRPIDTGQQVSMLMRDNGLVCQTLRDALDIAEEHGDIVTADLLTRRLGDHEKYVWMLRMQIA